MLLHNSVSFAAFPVHIPCCLKQLDRKRLHSFCGDLLVRKREAWTREFTYAEEPLINLYAGAMTSMKPLATVSFTAFLGAARIAL